MGEQGDCQACGMASQKSRYRLDADCHLPFLQLFRLAGDRHDTGWICIRNFEWAHRVHITETKLDMCINDEFGEVKDLVTKMESISKARFFLFFGCKRPEEKDERPSA